MADIKLGPSGSQTTLPAVIWLDGSAPEIPANYDTLVEESRMLDGTVRFRIFDYAPGVWELRWDGVTWANVQTIVGVASLKQKLVYTNEYTDNTNHNVVVTAYGYSLKGDTAARTPLYIVSVSLKEALG